MIISASRRTDLPACYADWFMQRIHAGWCEVPNPFNSRQISRVPLDPGSVDAMVFWTRNPRPLMPHLAELDRLGHRYYFLYTLTGYPRELDPGSPDARASAACFRELADRLGPDRLAWRYDPIILSNLTPADFHLKNFERLCRLLEGAGRRCIVSFLDRYRKIEGRLAALAEAGVLIDPEHVPRPREGAPGAPPPRVAALAGEIAAIASAGGFAVQSCAEAWDLSGCGIRPGACIDAELLGGLFGIEIPAGKDPSQRPACGCAASRDIGMYDSCPAGCVYCYAVGSPERARANLARHDRASARLVAGVSPASD